MNHKAAILGRHPRTKLTDLREQSECLTVTLSFSTKEQCNAGHRTRRADTSTTATAAARAANTAATTTYTSAGAGAGCYPSSSSSLDWYDKNHNNGANCNTNTQQNPGVYRADGVVGVDINNTCAPIADGGGASFARGISPQEEEEEEEKQEKEEKEEEWQAPPVVPTAAATICVVGTRAAVDSAGVLLGVVLDYMRREREMQEGGIAVRERLLVRLRLFRKPNCVICCTFVSTKTVKNSL